MDMMLILAVILFFPVILLGFTDFFALINAKTLFTSFWILCSALIVYYWHENGLIDRFVWQYLSLKKPSEQIIFTSNSENIICNYSVYANNWVAEVATVASSFDTKSVYLRVLISPQISGASTPSFNDIHDTIRNNGSLLTAAKNLQSGDEITFSGLVTPSPNCKLEDIDKDFFIIGFDNIVRHKGKSFPFIYPLMLILWIILSFPCLFYIYRNRSNEV